VLVLRSGFPQAFLAAALRLDQLALRAWLRRRLQNPPLVAIDPSRFTISDADISLLLKAAGEAPGEAAPDRKANGTKSPKFGEFPGVTSHDMPRPKT
jgi:hypothetical protein